MSDKIIVTDNKPIKVELVKGEDYFFCACGNKVKTFLTVMDHINQSLKMM
jgi:hypothetical protein